MFRSTSWDSPGESEEGLFDAVVDFGRSLHESDAKLIGKLSTLVHGDRPFVRPIRFVTNENLIDAFGRMLFDVGVPRADVW